MTSSTSCDRSPVRRLQGLFAFLKGRISQLVSNLRWFRAARRAEREDDWDATMGTNTTGFVTQVGLGIDREARRHAHEYFATLPRTFSEMVRTLPVAPNEFTFIDLGAGKGRVLLMAAALGFRRVLGVEISPKLCEIARMNVRDAHIDEEQRSRIEVCCSDALMFEFPPGPLAIYFFHSFDAEVFALVLGRLLKSLTEAPRPVYLAYLRPEHDPILRESRAFRVLAESPKRAAGSPEWPWKVYAATPGSEPAPLARSAQ